MATLDVVVLAAYLAATMAARPAAWRSPFHHFLIIVFGTLAALAVRFAIGHPESRWRKRVASP